MPLGQHQRCARIGNREQRVRYIGGSSGCWYVFAVVGTWRRPYDVSGSTAIAEPPALAEAAQQALARMRWLEQWRDVHGVDPLAPCPSELRATQDFARHPVWGV